MVDNRNYEVSTTIYDTPGKQVQRERGGGAKMVEE